jgi:hypothetical protein
VKTRIRLTRYVHGVGVQGLVTKVSPDLAKVLIGQGRAVPYDQPAEKAPIPPEPAKPVPAEPPAPFSEPAPSFVSRKKEKDKDKEP